MLIRHADLERMFDGSVDLAFRRWKRPTVKTGGSLRTPLGVLEIVEVTALDDADVSEAVAAIDARLERLDRASKRGPWTEAVVRLIADHAGTRAPELAERMGQDKPWFKAQVRKLEELGLTESLDVGYRLSPRGAAWRAASRR